jgi:hypothetical protein
VTPLQLPTRINALVQYESNPDAAQSELRRIKSDLSSAKQFLSDMEMANRSIPEPTRRELGNKIRMYKDSISSLTKDLGGAEMKFSRNSLMSGAGANRPTDFDKSQDSRARMQATTDKLRGGTDQLSAASRTVEETINVGTGIMEELGRNRETLNRVRGNVRTQFPSVSQPRTAEEVSARVPPTPVSIFHSLALTCAGRRSTWHYGHGSKNITRYV